MLLCMVGDFQKWALISGIGQHPRACDVEKPEKQESFKPKSLLASYKVSGHVWVVERWYELLTPSMV